MANHPLWHRCDRFFEKSLPCPYHSTEEGEDDDTSCWKTPWDEDCQIEEIPVAERIPRRPPPKEAAATVLAQVATDLGAYQRYWPDFEPQPYRPPWGAPRLPGLGGEPSPEPIPAGGVPGGVPDKKDQPRLFPRALRPGFPGPVDSPFSAYAEAMRLMQERMVRSLVKQAAGRTAESVQKQVGGTILPWPRTDPRRPLVAPERGLAMSRAIETALAGEVGRRFRPDQNRGIRKGVDLTRLPSDQRPDRPVHTVPATRFRSRVGTAAAIGGGALVAYLASRGLRPGGGGGFHFNVQRRLKFGYAR